MKKKLEAELISIAHRILQLKDKTTLSQLQEESRLLYEKLTILNFSETHFAGAQPTIGQIKIALETDESEELREVQQKIKEIIKPSVAETIEGKQELEQPSVKVEIQKQEMKKDSSALENKPELVIEEVNARVTEDLFVPATTQSNKHSSFSNTSSSPSTYEKNDKEGSISAIDSDSSDKIDEDNNKPKSLNDQLRKEIHIGLNDRLAFIKYLFEGSAPDYNRVLSQLNTLRNKGEAEEFIANMIKPDYHNWEGKGEYEERFMDIVLSKFDH